MCTSSASNVIYHKFSHGAAFYTLNGKKVQGHVRMYNTDHTIIRLTMLVCLDGWMDDMRFYVLFNGISVISG